MVEAIQKENPQAKIWQGGGVGTGGGLESLTEFVDVARATGQRAVANLSFDLTEVHPDGSSSTRAQLTAKEQSALSYARDNGVLVVASSGNQGGAMSAFGQASQPSDNLIVVGAANEHDRASYSSYGNGLDLVADVGVAGTSSAAATVTGTIAKLWNTNPGLNSQQVEQMLTTTATDLKTPGWDAETGAGLLNSTGAIALATHTTPEPIVFSGAQLIQQVPGALGGATWESRDGAVASEQTNRFIGGSAKRNTGGANLVKKPGANFARKPGAKLVAQPGTNLGKRMVTGGAKKIESGGHDQTLGRISGLAAGTAIGQGRKDFFLGRRLEKDPRALAVARRTIRGQLGAQGVSAFDRVPRLRVGNERIASPRQTYTVLRRYANYASGLPDSGNLLRSLAKDRPNKVKGTIGEIGRIPKSSLRRSRIQSASHRINGREAVDRVYKRNPLLGRQTIVDVKNYNFNRPYYARNIAQTIDGFGKQVARRQAQYPGAKIKYEFVGKGRVPTELRSHLRGQGVKVVIPLRTRVQEAARVVRESKLVSGVREHSTALRTSIRESKPVSGVRERSTVLRTSIRESKPVSSVRQVAQESRTFSQARQVATRVGNSGAARGVGRALSRIAAPVGAVIDSVQLINAYNQDGGFGENFQSAAGSVAGGWGGAAAGAAIGTAIAPGVGTIIGGVVGGIAGSEVGDDIAVGAKKAWKGIFG